MTPPYKPLTWTLTIAKEFEKVSHGIFHAFPTTKEKKKLKFLKL